LTFYGLHAFRAQSERGSLGRWCGTIRAFLFFSKNVYVRILLYCVLCVSHVPRRIRPVIPAPHAAHSMYNILLCYIQRTGTCAVYYIFFALVSPRAHALYILYIYNIIRIIIIIIYYYNISYYYTDICAPYKRKLCGAPPDAMRSGSIRQPAAASACPDAPAFSTTIYYPLSPTHTHTHTSDTPRPLQPRTLVRQLHVAAAATAIAVCKGRLDVTSSPDGSIRYPGVQIRSSSHNHHNRILLYLIYSLAFLYVRGLSNCIMPISM